MPESDAPDNNLPLTRHEIAEDQADLALITAAAAEAAKIALSYFRRDPEVWLKDGHSPVSEADLAVDRYLREVLLQARPDYGWISEETADALMVNDRKRAFVVDPIDGTRAYLAGQDQWCISIAVIEKGRPCCGVLDCPAKDEIMTATRGGGAHLNGQVIVAKPLQDGDDHQDADKIDDRIAHKIAHKIAMPRPSFNALPDGFRQKVTFSAYVPSLAYRIALVGRGELSGTFVRPGAHDWDLAAADLILTETGGTLVTNLGDRLYYGLNGMQKSGKKPYSHGILVASIAGFEQEMLSVVGNIPLS